MSSWVDALVFVSVSGFWIGNIAYYKKKKKEGKILSFAYSELFSLAAFAIDFQILYLALFLVFESQ